jgi:asparagine synthase (glutamine-hydrolysing)
VVHAPRTLAREVWQVEPAHVVEVDASGVRARPYWPIQWAAPSTRRPLDREVVDSLQEAVDGAVARRVHPGAATGLYLSGGLGSTAVALAARKRFLTVPTFTVSFAEDPNPESPFAGRIARLLGLENHELVVGSADLAAAFDPAIDALGHPVGHPAVLLQLLLGRSARERVRVVLSGDGGEELFGGRFLDRLGAGLDFGRWIAQLPAPLRQLAGRGFLRTRFGRFSGPVEAWLAELGVGGMGLFPPAGRARLLRDQELVRPDVARRVLAPMFAGIETDPVNAALHGVLRSALTESTLVRADRTAAASGLAIRFPLLDRQVVERAAALPGSVKLRRVAGTLHTRWPLRAMVAGSIPPALVNRPRRGMPVPLDAWLAGSGRLFLEDRFSRLRRDPYGLWVPARLDELRAGVGRSAEAGRQLWSLFLLDGWLAGLAG